MLLQLVATRAAKSARMFSLSISSGPAVDADEAADAPDSDLSQDLRRFETLPPTTNPLAPIAGATPPGPPPEGEPSNGHEQAESDYAAVLLAAATAGNHSKAPIQRLPLHLKSSHFVVLPPQPAPTRPVWCPPPALQYVCRSPCPPHPAASFLLLFCCLHYYRHHHCCHCI